MNSKGSWKHTGTGLVCVQQRCSRSLCVIWQMLTRCLVSTVRHLSSKKESQYPSMIMLPTGVCHAAVHMDARRSVPAYYT